MSDDALWRCTAEELRGLYERREAAPVEVARSVLERIEAVDGELHAFLHLDEAITLAAAEEAERTWLSGETPPVLCGIPVSIKDTIDTGDMPTTYGSFAFREHRPERDAPCVELLRASGAVPLGKTNTPEFALRGDTWNRLGPETRNPWDLARTSGGSSGGASAAVAAGMGPLALGTDGAGSIRGPAAYTGLVGLKPTFGRVPRGGWRGSPLRSHTGPIARTVADTALLLQASAGYDTRDAHSWESDTDVGAPLDIGALRGARVAFASTELQPGLDEEVAAAVDGTALLLRDAGCDLVVDAPPHREPVPGVESVGPQQYSPAQYAAVHAISPTFFDEHRSEFTSYGLASLEAGREMPGWLYQLVRDRDERYRVQVREWFRDYNYFLCAVWGTAPLIPENREAPVQPGGAGGQRGPSWTAGFNVTGNPAAAVPYGLSDGGLPIGVQIVGRFGDDLGVLRVALVIEQGRPAGALLSPLLGG